MHQRLDLATASSYARAGLDNIARQYPNHPGHLLTGPADLREPRELHPVFYGSYDWHSSVHQHWMLVRLLRRFPDLPQRDAIHGRFDTHLVNDPGAVGAEVAYLQHPARRTFERPYGWAWLLLLSAELAALAVDPEAPPSDRAAGARWAAGLAPLTGLVSGRLLGWLSTSPYPNRVGTHPNSAFACGLALEAVHRTSAPHTDTPPTGDTDDAPADPWTAQLQRALRSSIGEAVRRWYLDDRAAPTRYEPSSADFLSPTLVEAELLAQVLPRDQWITWLDGFLSDPSPLLTPATVTDRTDPQTVHLDGLNLSRAWGWRRIAGALPEDHPLRRAARDAADAHRAASLPHVLDDYVGAHWLPTFAVRLDDIEVAGEG